MDHVSRQSIGNYIELNSIKQPKPKPEPEPTSPQRKSRSLVDHYHSIIISEWNIFFGLNCCQKQSHINTHEPGLSPICMRHFCCFLFLI